MATCTGKKISASFLFFSLYRKHNSDLQILFKFALLLDAKIVLIT